MEGLVTSRTADLFQYSRAMPDALRAGSLYTGSAPIRIASGCGSDVRDHLDIVEIGKNQLLAAFENHGSRTCSRN